VHILYLDFDGVLHPGAARALDLKFKKRTNIEDLFENAPLLEKLLTPYPLLNLVLSTSWVETFGLEQSIEMLTPGLQTRVIGATFNSAQRPPIGTSRYEEIFSDVKRRSPSRWLSVDDDERNWPAGELHHLAHVPTELGLKCPIATADLKAKLAALFAP
jgi:hypothetical protein